MKLFSSLSSKLSWSVHRKSCAMKKLLDNFQRYAASTTIVRCNGTSTTSIFGKKLAAEFNILCINSSGQSSNFVVSKTALYNELGFSMRDLRFQHANMINVRDQKVIMRFQELKAVVCTDAVLLIDFVSNDKLSNMEIKRFCGDLPILLTGYELNARDLPFEYRAIEAILSFNVSKLSTILAELEPDITKILNALTDPSKPVIDRSLVHVLLQKNTKLNEFGTSVREFIEVLEEWLENDEDLRDLCISIDPRQGSERSSYDAHIFQKSNNRRRDMEEDAINQLTPHLKVVNFDRTINLQDEMELLLESFLKNAEEIHNKVSELTSAIENSNNTILINLDSHRNMLLRLEIQLTIGMFACTLFSMIGMAFGMNLTSHFEEHPAAFWVATGVMVGGSLVTWKLLLRYLDRAPMAFKQSIILNSLISKPNRTSVQEKLLSGELRDEEEMQRRQEFLESLKEQQEMKIKKSPSHEKSPVRRMQSVDRGDLEKLNNSTSSRMQALGENYSDRLAEINNNNQVKRS